MTEMTHDSSLIVGAVLHGGPADMPPDARLRPAATGESHIKVPHLDGYEHFERTGEVDTGVDGSAPHAIYRWVGRTRVAE